MEKRTLIGIVLIIIIFFISNEFIWKPKQEAMLKKQEEQNKEQIAINNQTDQEESVKNTIEEPKQEISTTFLQSDSIDVNNSIVLENDLIEINFSNDGGTITDIILKEYEDTRNENYVNLLLDIDQGFQTILHENDGTTIDLNQLRYHYELYANKVVFHLPTPKGNINREYELTDNYQLSYSLKLENFSTLNEYKTGFAEGIADTEEYLKYKKTDYRIYSQIENQLFNATFAKLKNPIEKVGKIDWVGIRSKYFLLGLIPDDLIYTQKVNFFKENESPAFWMQVKVTDPTFDHHYQMYLGPLLETELSKFSNGMDHTIQMGPGFLRWLSKIFQSFFLFLYKLTHSWGFCIIIFAFVMKIILYPFTHKSLESGMKMQQVQPKMKEIQSKYRHDPKLMQKELQKMYKEHGVSPLGGCLPMVFQIPIFIALLPIFRNSIGLRQAAFLWIQDLSAPDPYLIFPIFMAVFMFFQQMLMRPKNQNIEDMDEKQKAALQSQKMMGYIMPIVMFFLFKSFPAGLVIYWSIFNVFSVVQQYYLRKKFASLQTNSVSN